MPELSLGQFNLTYNMLSFALATMFASFIFFILAQQQVEKKYQPALIMSAIVVAVAGYHYFRIFESWDKAYELVDGRYVATGVPFNDGYRYVDWLLTVPLLVAELVAVLVLPRAKSMALTAKLALAAVLMIALGYPGEVATSNSVRALWGTLSTLPFLYLLWVLWVELGQAAGRQPENVRVLLRNIRLLLLATWGFYPIVYMLPFLGIAGSSALVGVQIGYSIADVLAKCGYGLMIYAIARAKSEVDQVEMAKVPILAPAGNTAD